MIRRRTAHALRRLADRLVPPEPSIQEQILANQQELLALSKQGPEIVAAVTAAVSGGLGGRIGLGLQDTRLRDAYGRNLSHD